MAELERFSISVDGDLLREFDRGVEADGYPTRSKAVADLMRASLVRRQWKTGHIVAAAVVLLYDHHRHDLVSRLTRIQHDHHAIIVSSQHVHLDHDTCMEVIIVRGTPSAIEDLANRLKAVKGVKHASLAAASAGDIP